MNQLKTVNTKSLLLIALPIMVSQAAETVMMFADRLFLANLGTDHIGPAMSGGLSSFVFQSFFIGVLSYLNAITAQHYGAGKPGEAIKYTVQGIYMALIFYPFALMLIPVGIWIFHVSGHATNQIALEAKYFSLLMFGSVLVFIKCALSGYLLGMGKTRSVMGANFVGMLINVPLNYIFIYGKLGSPAFGIAGAAYGTIGGSLVIALILVFFILREDNWKKEFHWKYMRFDFTHSKFLLKFGTPAGLENIINVFAFNFYLQFMHSYSPQVAASVTIAFNYDLVAFIPLVGVGTSALTMVGYQIGAKDIIQAKKAVRLNLFFAYGYAAFMVFVFLIFAPILVRFFSADPAVIPLAEVMLRMAAIYTLADATQVVFSGSLRGAGDTKWVMLLAACVNWSLAISSFFMVKVLKIDPVLMWGIFVFHVVMLGVTMFLRYRTGRWKQMTLVDLVPSQLSPEKGKPENQKK